MRSRGAALRTQRRGDDRRVRRGALTALAILILAGGTGMAKAGRHVMSAWKRARPAGAVPVQPSARDVRQPASASARVTAGIAVTPRPLPAAPPGTAVTPPPRPAAPAWARVGAIFDRDGSHHCTASVIGRDLILTAAHCDTAGGRFAPGYHGGHNPYGRWRLGRRTVDGKWSSHRDEDHDVAFVRVHTLRGKHIGDVVGYNPIVFNRGFGLKVTVSGYPTDRSAPVSGSNTTTKYNARQMRIRVRGLADGSSGGPWITGQGEVIGVVGGHQTGGEDDDVSYSVYFGDWIRGLYRSADE